MANGQGVQLGVEIALQQLAAMTLVEGGLHQLGADGAAAMRFQHRHAADVAISEHADRSDRLIAFKGEPVLRQRAVIVPLQLLGHRLLFDKNLLAYGL